MLNVKKLLSMAAAFVVMVVMSAASHAAPIPVANFSFENPDLGGSGFNNNVTDWVDSGANNQSFVEVLGGGSFATDGTQHVGIQGDQFIYQDLGLGYEAGDYTLDVSFGHRANSGFTPVDGVDESRISLFAGDPTLGGVLLVSGIFDAGALADGTFGEGSVTYTADGSEVGNIFIVLADDGPGRAHFDNVRLDFVEAVPEPASASLIGLAALGLLRRRRRLA